MGRRRKLTVAIPVDESDTEWITEKPVLARQLVTIDPTCEIWSDTEISRLSVKDCLVRVQPPSDATDTQIELVRQACYDYGAEAVKVLSRLPGGSLGAESEGFDVSGRPRSSDLRAAVYAVASRMKSGDEAALRAELDLVMEKAGL